MSPKEFSKKNILIVLSVLLVFMTIFPSGVQAKAQDVFDTLTEQDAFVFKGDLISLKVYSLTRIAVSVPGIVRILEADVDQLLLVGNKVGETPIYIWDEHGKRTIVVHCFQEDVETIIPRIQALMDSAKIKGVEFDVNMFEGKIVATGKVSKDQREDLDTIFGNYSEHIIDMVKEEGALIQVDAQITELSTSLNKELGFEWTNSIEYNESIPTTDGDLWDLFKIGDFSRATALKATVAALISEGKAQVLSKPSIVVTNGESSTFTVGGEIPVTSAITSAGGTTTESVTFRAYGVTVTVTPTIVGDKIDLTLTVTVSDVGESYGDNASYTTTTVSTELRLGDKQTIVLAGLIKHTETDTTTRVPFLSSIPIVGMLFRNKTLPVSDQEIVISVTPTILRDKTPEEKAAEKAREEAELLGEDSIGGQEGDQGLAEGLSGEGVLSDEASLADGEDLSEQKGLSLEEGLPEEDAFAKMTKKEGLLEEKQELIEKMSDEEPADPGEKGDQEEGVLSGQDKKEAQKKEMSPEEAELKAAIDALAKEKIFQEAKAKEASKAKFLDGEAAVLSQGVKSPSEAIAEYVQNIQKQISQTISFPYKAKERGWEGTTKLSLTILSDGSLNDLALKESSGYSIFDEDAINTTQILAPFGAFPAEIDLEELVVTIPIVYSQEAFLQGAESK